MADAWLTARIASTEALIEAYEGAITALLTDNIQEYSINTGQTVTRVTRVDLASLQTKLDSLYALRQRLRIANGDVAGAGVGAPRW